MSTEAPSAPSSCENISQLAVEERRTEDFGLTGVVVARDAEETRPPVRMSVIA
jgi:hypothetical protein